jgi:hypothetical protein
VSSASGTLRIRYPAGDTAPLPGATVIVARVELLIQAFVTETGQDGAFSMADVPEGKWRINVCEAGFETLEGTVTLAPGARATRLELVTGDVRAHRVGVRQGRVAFAAPDPSWSVCILLESTARPLTATALAGECVHQPLPQRARAAPAARSAPWWTRSIPTGICLCATGAPPGRAGHGPARADARDLSRITPPPRWADTPERAMCPLAYVIQDGDRGSWYRISAARVGD